MINLYHKFDFSAYHSESAYCNIENKKNKKNR